MESEIKRLPRFKVVQYGDEINFVADQGGPWVLWDGEPSENYGAKQLKADFEAVVQERDTLARRVAELEQALTASAQFLYPGVDRGPAINGWANTVEMVEKSVPAPPVRD